jgi:hypothetical protein
MVKNEAEPVPLYSSSPPSHAHSSIEVTYLENQQFSLSTRPKTANKILQLSRPHPVVLVKRVLVRHGLEPRDLISLSDDLSSRIVKKWLHYSMSAVTVYVWRQEYLR